MADISENLFQAIDILTAKRLEGLKYDKTLLCEIIDDTNAERGEYRVSDSSSTFIAYSDVTTYRTGTSVYVTIPEGDYSQRKIITGKYVEDGGEYYTYIAPFDSYLDITGNYIEEAKVGANYLLANGAITEVTVYEWNRSDENKIPTQYSRLGLRANFRTWLNDLQPVTGSYGLRIDIISRETQNVMSDEVSHKNYSYYLDSSDFYGDIYNFETFYQQEAVFDISMISEIQGLKITFYQSNNFYDISKNKIPTMDDGELLDENIHVNDVYLSFGFDASQFIEDEVFLYTLDGETYDVSGAKVLGKDGQVYNKNVKLLQARWVHFLSKGHAIMVDEADDFSPEEATLHWYKYVQEDGVYDPIAGYLWQEMPNTENTFEQTITPDIRVANEKYKLIIEYPNAEWVQNASAEQISNLGSVEEYGIYTYTDTTNEKGEIVRTWGWKQQGSLHTQMTTLKSAIKTLEDKIDAGKDVVGDKAVLETKKQQLKSIETSLNSFMNSVVQIVTECEGKRTFYYSDILTLVNETEVPTNSNLELVDGLNIIVDEGGLKGNYAIYGMTNEILKNTEAMKSRTLEAVYKSIVTHDDALDKASSICWKIPADNTMIAEPILGTDYMYESYAQANDLTEEYQDIDYIQTSMEDNGVTVPLVNLQTGELIPYQGFYWLIRQGTEIYHNEQPDVEETSLQISVKQLYKIKKYYQQNAKNNTVHCIVTKNGFNYNAQATMTFGLHGTNGTDNTLLLQLRKYKKENGKVVPLELVSAVYPEAQDIMIEARLFDYNNEEVQIDKVNWSMYSKGTSSSLYVATGDSSLSYTRNQKMSSIDQFGLLQEEDQEITIYAIPVYAGALKADLSSFMHNIVKAQVSYGDCTVGQTQTGSVDFTNVDEYGIPIETSVEPKTRSINLTAYLPIPFASSTNLTWAEIPTQIIYDASGAKPAYYKDTIKICGKDGNYVQITKCEVKHTDETKNNAYYPTIKTTKLNTTGQGVQSTNYSLKPLNMFLNGLKTEVSIVCTVGNLGTWIQPLLIIQNRWPSAVLNEWDGSLTIDEKNGTILSTMVGAGKKESDNSFTGVLMGDIATGADINTSQTGVYGFHHGVQSFGLKDDGTAFFGKAGKGQIIFDGNSGRIQSMSYSIDGGTGMMIDLDDGIIDMKGSKSNTTTNDNYTKRVYTSSGSRILLDVAGGSNKPYLLIQGTEDDYNTIDDSIDVSKQLGENSDLMYVGIGKYYLKTLDYLHSNKDDGSGGQGMKIDLAKGSIEGYNFSLKGFCNSEDVAEYNGSYFSLNSNGNPFFRVHFKKNDGTSVQQEGLNLIEITKSKFYLQSQDFNDKKDKAPLAGVRLDLGGTEDWDGKGRLKGYNFSLEAINANEEDKHYGSYVLIESDGEPYFRVHYKDNEGTDNQQEGLNLIEISNDDFYIQSQDYCDDFDYETAIDPTIGTNSGIRFDLGKYGSSKTSIGKITGYNFSLTGVNPSGTYAGSYFKLNSNGNPYFQVRYRNSTGTQKQQEGLDLIYISNDDFYLQSQDYYDNDLPDETDEEYKGKGIHFNLKDGALKGYNFSLMGVDNSDQYYGSFYKLSSDIDSEPFLQVYFKDRYSTSMVQQNGLPLLYISRDEFYMNSHDWNDGESGTYINLAEGLIKSYNFDLLSSNPENQESFVRITNGKNGNPYLQISNEETEWHSDYEKNLFYASSDKFYLRSLDSSLVIDLKENKIEATKNFLIQAYQNADYQEDDKVIVIDSGATDNPLRIGHKFSVAWDGSVFASHITATEGGQIGPFTIAEDSLYTGNFNTADTVYLGSDKLSVSDKFYVDDGGNVYIAGNVDIAGNCDVTGYIQSGTDGSYYKLTSGEGTVIAGWTISTDSISKDNITLSSSSGFIKAGDNSTYCQMNDDGTFFANSATIEGTITSGDGEIGGWTINSGSIEKGNIILSSDGGYIQAGSGETYCQMNDDGTFYAYGATIKGVIEAEEGEIGGWTIASDGFNYNDYSYYIGTGHSFTISDRSEKPYSIKIGDYFGVDFSGKIECTSAHIGFWEFSDEVVTTYGKNEGDIDSVWIYSDGQVGFMKSNNCYIILRENSTSGFVSTGINSFGAAANDHTIASGIMCYGGEEGSLQLVHKKERYNFQDILDRIQALEDDNSSIWDSLSGLRDSTGGM